MIGVLVAGSIFLIMAAAVGLAVLFFLQKDKQEFSFKTLFSTYFYLVAIISLVASFMGASLITKAVASDLFGREFSYHNYAVDMGTEMVPIEKGLEIDNEKQRQVAIAQEEERIEELYAEDLYNGISMLVVGLLFLITHVYGWQTLESAKTRQKSVLYRAYVIIQLVLFSVITLFALPMALSSALRFWLQPVKDGSNFIPGEPISFALWATPIWLFFIWITIKTYRKQ